MTTRSAARSEHAVGLWSICKRLHIVWRVRLLKAVIKFRTGVHHEPPQLWLLGLKLGVHGSPCRWRAGRTGRVLGPVASSSSFSDNKSWSPRAAAARHRYRGWTGRKCTRQQARVSVSVVPRRLHGKTRRTAGWGGCVKRRAAPPEEEAVEHDDGTQQLLWTSGPAAAHLSQPNGTAAPVRVSETFFILTAAGSVSGPVPAERVGPWWWRCGCSAVCWGCTRCTWSNTPLQDHGFTCCGLEMPQKPRTLRSSVLIRV